MHQVTAACVNRQCTACQERADALPPSEPSSHAHGNCELCDWQEEQIARLQKALYEAVKTAALRDHAFVIDDRRRIEVD